MRTPDKQPPPVWDRGGGGEMEKRHVRVDSHFITRSRFEAQELSDFDLLHTAIAYHEAGHAVMTLYLGGWIGPDGVDFKACRCHSCFETYSPRHRERIDVLNSMAGWRAEYLWHGKGGSREIADSDVLWSLGEIRYGNDDDDESDDHHIFAALLGLQPDGTDDELAKLYSDYSAECYAILKEPWVWAAVKRVAEALLTIATLSNDDCERLVYCDETILDVLAQREGRP